MKKCLIIGTCTLMFLCSCAGEFNRVYKSADNDYRYEYAKEAFAMGKFQQASTLLEEIITLKKGSEEEQEMPENAEMPEMPETAEAAQNA